MVEFNFVYTKYLKIQKLFENNPDERYSPSKVLGMVDFEPGIREHEIDIMLSILEGEGKIEFVDFGTQYFYPCGDKLFPIYKSKSTVQKKT